MSGNKLLKNAVGIVILLGIVGLVYWGYLDDIEEVREHAIEVCTEQHKQFEVCRTLVRRRHPRCIERHWDWSRYFAKGDIVSEGSLDRDGYRRCLLKDIQIRAGFITSATGEGVAGRAKTRSRTALDPVRFVEGRLRRGRSSVRVG